MPLAIAILINSIVLCYFLNRLKAFPFSSHIQMSYSASLFLLLNILRHFELRPALVAVAQLSN